MILTYLSSPASSLLALLSTARPESDMSLISTRLRDPGNRRIASSAVPRMSTSSNSPVALGYRSGSYRPRLLSPQNTTGTPGNNLLPILCRKASASSSTQTTRSSSLAEYFLCM